MGEQQLRQFLLQRVSLGSLGGSMDLGTDLGLGFDWGLNVSFGVNWFIRILYLFFSAIVGYK